MSHDKSIVIVMMMMMMTAISKNKTQKYNIVLLYKPLFTKATMSRVPENKTCSSSTATKHNSKVRKRDEFYKHKLLKSLSRPSLSLSLSLLEVCDLRQEPAESQ